MQLCMEEIIFVSARVKRRRWINLQQVEALVGEEYTVLPEYQNAFAQVKMRHNACDWNTLWHRPILPAQKALSEMQQKTLVGFFTEDLRHLSKRRFVPRNLAMADVLLLYERRYFQCLCRCGWRIYLGRIIEKAVIINYSYLAKLPFQS